MAIVAVVAAVVADIIVAAVVAEVVILAVVVVIVAVVAVVAVVVNLAVVVVVVAVAVASPCCRRCRRHPMVWVESQNLEARNDIIKTLRSL